MAVWYVNLTTKTGPTNISCDVQFTESMLLREKRESRRWKLHKCCSWFYFWVSRRHLEDALGQGEDPVNNFWNGFSIYIHPYLDDQNLHPYLDYQNLHPYIDDQNLHPYLDDQNLTQYLDDWSGSRLAAAAPTSSADSCSFRLNCLDHCQAFFIQLIFLKFDQLYLSNLVNFICLNCLIHGHQTLSSLLQPQSGIHYHHCH